MQDFLIVTGMILKVIPIGDYDRRITILTKERGKISAFAKGARRQTSRMLAATNPFSFGEFKLYVGKNYNLMETQINNYFEELRTDYEAAYVGMFFLEVMDYYTRENSDEKEMLKLLYQSLRALTHDKIHKELVQYIFEIKASVLNGEFPGLSNKKKYLDSTRYAVEFITVSPVEKLYTFTVSKEVCDELCMIVKEYRKRSIDVSFKSLDILKKL